MNGMKRIRALRAFPYSLDGVTVREAKPGETIAIRAGAADALVAEHYAEIEAGAPVEISAADTIEGGGADSLSGSADTVTDSADGEAAPADMASPGGTNSRAARAAGTARARNAAS